jgi:23S rRNA (adenine2503-C2)-methyltransferase
MTLEELSDKLGGSGRSQLAWDCYSKGVDPHYLFSPDNEEEVDIDSPQQQKLFWKDEYKDKAKLKKQILPTPRQTQQLGSSALTLLSNLHSNLPNNDSGAIENGLATLVHMSPSSDGTTKLLIRLVDGYEVETVLIPFWTNNRGSRTTVCISSQVGCRQGCTFCGKLTVLPFQYPFWDESAIILTLQNSFLSLQNNKHIATGKMGKLRSLTTDEILVQMFYAQKIVRLSNNNNNDYEGDEIDKPPPLPPITNVVFMGMGEPADAADSVRGAIKILTRNELFQLSATRVTVSTVAPTPDAFHEFVDSKCGKYKS